MEPSMPKPAPQEPRPMPIAGGSYVRDPETGALTKAAASPKAPAKPTKGE